MNTLPHKPTLEEVMEPSSTIIDLTEPLVPQKMIWRINGSDEIGLYQEFTYSANDLQTLSVVRVYNSSWAHVIGSYSMGEEEFSAFPKRLDVEFTSLPEESAKIQYLQWKPITYKRKAVIDLRDSIMLQADGLQGNIRQDGFGSFWQYAAPTNQYSTALIARVYRRAIYVTHVIGEITLNSRNQWVYSPFPNRLEVNTTIQ